MSTNIHIHGKLTTVRTDEHGCTRWISFIVYEGENHAGKSEFILYADTAAEWEAFKSLAATWKKLATAECEAA